MQPKVPLALAILGLASFLAGCASPPSDDAAGWERYVPPEQPYESDAPPQVLQVPRFWTNADRGLWVEMNASGQSFEFWMPPHANGDIEASFPCVSNVSVNVSLWDGTESVGKGSELVYAQEYLNMSCETPYGWVLEIEENEATNNDTSYDVTFVEIRPPERFVFLVTSIANDANAALSLTVTSRVDNYFLGEETCCDSRTWELEPETLWQGSEELQCTRSWITLKAEAVLTDPNGDRWQVDYQNAAECSGSRGPLAEWHVRITPEWKIQWRSA